LQAFDYAREEFTRRGFVMDDPARYEAMCTTHDAASEALCGWSCRVVYKHNGRLHAPASSRTQVRLPCPTGHAGHAGHAEGEQGPS
jgi:hypothetical protein